MRVPWRARGAPGRRASRQRTCPASDRSRPPGPRSASRDSRPAPRHALRTGRATAIGSGGRCRSSFARLYAAVGLDGSGTGAWRTSCSGDGPMLKSPPMYERPGYSSLIGRIRNNVRTYIRKQIELPKQEIAEILKANLNAAKWFGIAFAFLFLTLIAFAVFVIGLIAIWLPLWASALIALVLFGAVTALLGWGGYKRLELRGPTRSIQSIKETVRWAKARVLGRNASYPTSLARSTTTSTRSSSP